MASSGGYGGNTTTAESARKVYKTVEIRERLVALCPDHYKFTFSQILFNSELNWQQFDLCLLEICIQCLFFHSQLDLATDVMQQEAPGGQDRLDIDIVFCKNDVWCRPAVQGAGSSLPLPWTSPMAVVPRYNPRGSHASGANYWFEFQCFTKYYILPQRLTMGMDWRDFLKKILRNFTRLWGRMFISVTLIAGNLLKHNFLRPMREKLARLMGPEENMTDIMRRWKSSHFLHATWKKLHWFNNIEFPHWILN